MSRRSHWFSIHTPLSPSKAMAVKIAAFLLPLLTWCVASYVPWVWHPMVLITEAGDSPYRVGDRLPKEDFGLLNTTLSNDHKALAKGEPANPVFLPPPHEVGRALYRAFTTPPFSKRDPWLHQSLWASLQLIFWGFVLSAAVGIPIGIICGTFDAFSKLIEPFVDFVRYMPAPAFGPLMVAIFGIDTAPKIAIIFIGTFFQIVLVVANTTRLVDASLIEAAQTLGAKGRKIITKVIIPAILPHLYRDVRILIGASWVVLIIAELTGAASGISYFITLQGKYRNYPNVYAGIIIIGLIGLATDQVLRALSPRLFPWTAERSGKYEPLLSRIRSTQERWGARLRAPLPAYTKRARVATAPQLAVDPTNQRHADATAA